MSSTFQGLRNKANGLAALDNNLNLTANNLIEGFTTTATSASTTTLTASSTAIQVFTGTTTQTMVLPSALTLANGTQYTIINQSTGAITVNANGNGNITTVSASGSTTVTLTANNTANGTWYTATAGTLNTRLTGYVATAGTIVDTDTILTAFNKVGTSLNTTFWQQGRIYGITESPNTDTTSSGSTTLYFGPSYSGNIITLYNTTISQWVTQTFSEVSITMTQTAGNYDVYITSSSSTEVTISLIPWTNNTTPPTRGTQNGRLVKNGASESLLVGVIRTNGTNTFSWLGSRWIINVYNQTNMLLLAQDTSAASYNFNPATANIIRACNANTTDGAGRFSGLFDQFNTRRIKLNNFQVITTSSTTNSSGYISGIGVDSTTVNKAYSTESRSNVVAGTLGNNLSTNFTSSELTGYHYFQRTEASTVNNGIWTLALANPTFGQGGLMQGDIMG